MRRSTATWVGAGLLCAATLAWGCGSKSKGKSGPTGPASMMGRVRDVSGAPVASAAVTVNGTTQIANDQGWFFFTDLTPADHLRVAINAATYVGTQRYVDVKPGRNTFLDVHLFTLGVPTAIDSTLGGPLTDGGLTSVNLPAGVFRNANGTAYSGMANVSLTVLDPTTLEGQQGIPGGFQGVPTGSSTAVPFETFGMFNVTAVDGSGNPLVLDSTMGMTATFPAPPGSGTPPTTVPLWNFNESTGVWAQTGMATLGSNGNYTGTLSGGSGGGSWNCDQPYATACVTGHVVTPEGKPAIGGLEVTSQGVSYAGTSTSYTDEGGAFTVLLKASTSSATESAQLYAQGGGLYTDTPTPIAMTPTQLASTGNCTDVGNVMLAYPLASVVLTWGVAPTDLDSHLTGPDGMGGRFHMSYSDKEPVGNIAALDTDDTDSYGPEVTSLLRAVPGTYVYSIKNYSGESGGAIAQSSAQIRAFFPGETRTFDVADATGTLTDDTAVWRVFKFTIGGDGSIGHIQPIMKLVPDDNTEAPFDP